MKKRLVAPQVLSASICLAILLGLRLLVCVSICTGQDSRRGIGLPKTESVKQLPVKSKRYALIIGVDQYEDTQISKLEGAANDARMLAESLKKYAGFSENNVFLLTTDQPPQYQPKRKVILRYLTNMKGLVPSDGLLLIAFAGHGMQRGGKAYLLPSDAEITENISYLEQNALTVDSVSELIRGMGVKQVIVLLDACRNDPEAGRSSTDNLLTEAFVRGFDFSTRNNEISAFITWYATEVGSRAYEHVDQKTNKKHGYFTQALVEALKGANGETLNERGEITLGRVMQYVKEVVSKRTRIEIGKAQIPFPIIEGYGEDIVIAVAPQPLNAPSTPKPIAADTVELSFWETIKNSDNPEDFKAYLRKYPHGQFTELAKIRANKAAPEESKSAKKEAIDPVATDAGSGQPVNSTPAATPVKGVLSEFEDPRRIGKRNIHKQGASFTSLDAEVRLGRQAAASFNSKAKFVEDPAITAYINRIGQKMALHSDAKVPFTIKVVDSDVINAFALPGGFLYLNWGLVLTMDSESELAGVMAHLIAHVAAHHGQERSLNPQFRHNAAELAVPVAFLDYPPNMEAEADMLSVQYCWAAGYDPNNVLTAFEKMQKAQYGPPSYLFASHVVEDNRLSRIHDLLIRFPDRDEYMISSSDFVRMKFQLVEKMKDRLPSYWLDHMNSPNQPILKRRKDGDN